MRLTAASTRLRCSTPRAICCAPGARVSSARPHGVHMGPDDTIWLTDDGDHTVRHCTLDGKVLMTLGVPGEPKPYMSGEPFHRCTHTASRPNGDLYVSDGYGNARIHKYTPDGKLLDVVGRARHRPRPVQRAAQYLLLIPTAGSMSPTARTTGCRFSTATASSRRNGTICTGRTACAWRWGRTRSSISAKAARRARSTATGPISARGSAIHTHKGEVLARLGRMHAGLEPGHFTSPHGIAVDRHGNIFVGELSGRSWGRFSKDPPPKRIRVLHKLEKSAD